MIFPQFLFALLIPVAGFQETPRAESGAAAVMVPADREAIDAAEATRAAIESVGDEPITCARDGSTYEMKACAAADMERETKRMQRYIEAATVRAHDVGDDDLTYWDSTPPVLPEPVRTIAEDRVAAGLVG